jgi:outer membrane protein OmpA-like peptidoglycan-associated protein
MRVRLAIGVLLASSSAVAQNRPADRSFDLTLFTPEPGPTDYFGVRSTRMSPHRGVGFSLLFDYQDSPLQLVDENEIAEPKDAVAYQATTHFLWSFGFFDRLQLGLAMPVVVAQDGEGVRPLLGPADTAPDLASTAIRDIRIDLKGRILGHDEGLGVGAAAAVILPSGDEQNFAGEIGVGLAPDLIADLRTSKLRLALNAGARLHSRSSIADVTTGHELVFGAGGSYQIFRSLAAAAETQFRFGVVNDAPPEPNVESRLGARFSPDPSGDLQIELAFGIGSFQAIGTPQWRLIAGVVYAPLGADGDADEILDRDDRCPEEAEDLDGFEDEDGCPDGDNDGDGLADSADQCADEAEDVDEHEDDDGCPDTDNDGDGIADADDRCRDEAEDVDHHEDEDGCPDADDDGDGVLDAEDRCPAEAEDRDGHDDADGCPDADNDGDGKPDGADRCPDAAEDVDQFEDDDGCPDPDNDHDGVADADDRCPAEPETINGTRDEDGCADAGAETVVLEGDAVVFRRPVGFARGAAELPERLGGLLAQAAQRLRARRAGPETVTVVVTGFGDAGTTGDDATALANRRAGAVRDALAGGGIPADAIRVAAGDAAARDRNLPQFEIRVEAGAH